MLSAPLPAGPITNPRQEPRNFNYNFTHPTDPGIWSIHPLAHPSPDTCPRRKTILPRGKMIRPRDKIFVPSPRLVVSPLGVGLVLSSTISFSNIWVFPKLKQLISIHCEFFLGKLLYLKRTLYERKQSVVTDAGLHTGIARVTNQL